MTTPVTSPRSTPSSPLAPITNQEQQTRSVVKKTTNVATQTFKPAPHTAKTASTHTANHTSAISKALQGVQHALARLVRRIPSTFTIQSCAAIAKQFTLQLEIINLLIHQAKIGSIHYDKLKRVQCIVKEMQSYFQTTNNVLAPKLIESLEQEYLNAVLNAYVINIIKEL